MSAPFELDSFLKGKMFCGEKKMVSTAPLRYLPRSTNSTVLTTYKDSVKQVGKIFNWDSKDKYEPVENKNNYFPHKNININNYIPLMKTNVSILPPIRIRASGDTPSSFSFGPLKLNELGGEIIRHIYTCLDSSKDRISFSKALKLFRVISRKEIFDDSKVVLENAVKKIKKMEKPTSRDTDKTNAFRKILKKTEHLLKLPAFLAWVHVCGINIEDFLKEVLDLNNVTKLTNPINSLYALALEDRDWAAPDIRLNEDGKTSSDAVKQQFSQMEEKIEKLSDGFIPTPFSESHIQDNKIFLKNITGFSKIGLNVKDYLKMPYGQQGFIDHMINDQFILATAQKNPLIFKKIAEKYQASRNNTMFIENLIKVFEKLKKEEDLQFEQQLIRRPGILDDLGIGNNQGEMLTKLRSKLRRATI